MTQAYLPRHADAALALACAQHPVVILDGPRGVGKTTSARRLAASTLEFPRDLPRIQADPQRALAALETPVLIDEWQVAGTDLMWAIKRLVDDRPGPGQFILTGSVEPATYGPTYPLTGRSVLVVMRPMTVMEREGRGAQVTPLERWVTGQEPPASAGSAGTFTVADLFRTGFPGALALPHSAAFLEGYAAVLAQRAGDEGRDASRLLRTLQVLATLEGQATPQTTVWEAADITKVTWSAYDGLLRRTHITVPSPSWESNRLKRLTSYPKRYLADAALAAVLAGETEASLRANPHVAGRYVESLVMQQLRPQVDAMKGTMGHVRTANGQREVDAVIDLGRQVWGVEVKSATSVTPHDARALEWFREQMGERFGGGLVVHTGGDSYPLGERIWAVSLDALTGTV